MAIGTTAALIGASAIGGIASANAAKKAASTQAAAARDATAAQTAASERAIKAQTEAANRAIDFQKETRDLVFDRLDPWYQGGRTANDALMFEMGLGSAPMIGGTAPEIVTVPGTVTGRGGLGAAPRFQRQTTPTRYRVGDQTFTTMEEAQAFANANKTGGKAYGGFTADPGYQFRLSQGQDAVNALAGAQGGLFSGATLQALTDYNQGLASQEYGNYFARLSGLAGQGLGAASGQANAAQNTAAGVANALSGLGQAQAQGAYNIGNAAATGAMNAGNALSAGQIGVGNAISGGINNGLGIWAYQQGLGGNQGGLTIGRSGSLFGGNSWG